MKKPQLASNLLKKESKEDPLNNILAVAHNLRDLEQIVTKYLPDAFEHRFQVSSYKDHKLVILCSSASWSSKLRFHTKHLSSKLKNHHELSDLKEICILTNLRAVTLKKIPKRRLPKAKMISAKNRDLLIETAEMESNRQLSDALRRLAKHAYPSNERK